MIAGVAFVRIEQWRFRRLHWQMFYSSNYSKFVIGKHSSKGFYVKLFRTGIRLKMIV